MTGHRFTLIIAIFFLGAPLSLTVGSHAAEQPANVICDIWPPYQIMEGKKVTGFSTEMVQAIYKRMDVPLDKVKAFPWKRALRILESGHADALFSANLTKARETFAHYPDEILFESPWLIWTRQNSDIKTEEDLKGKTIGVVMGYSYTKLFWDFIQTYCRVEEVTTDDINFKKLNMGRLDAIAAEYGNGIHLMKQLGIKSIVPNHDIVIKKDGLHIIFSRENVSEAFVRRFSDELKAFKKTPEYKILRYKYLGEKTTP